VSATAFAALGVAAVFAYALTPVAIRVAQSIGFLDRPTGHKGHQQPTPYLGGAAVGVALLATTILFADIDATLAAILGCTGALALLGTLDDRVPVPPAGRIAAELAATWVLFHSGVHWAPFGVGVLDFAVTALWIVGIVNAVNLMDNMDGAAATVVATSCAGIGALALIRGDGAIAVTAFAVTGACAGFLPRSLAGPARIFLGDGGSMPLGFLIAALAIMSAADRGDAVLVGAMLVGLPILDTTLVAVSRLRRGVTIVTPGRDHLTHRLLGRVNTPADVCLLLLAAQGLLVGLGVASEQAGEPAVIATAVALTAAGIGAIAVLDSPRWCPLAATVTAGAASQPVQPAMITSLVGE
jgi:UDP-GlcNAc:undecaprenyl-phosphate/decaprenyl-phosphate GlcNAc-1-phosphate transferase